jgi:aspartate carbamoyltransferase catalytic subunit
MHPGPMNRGVEMLIDPSDIPNSLIHRQVTNGVSVRMAVLFDLLSAEEMS